MQRLVAKSTGSYFHLFCLERWVTVSPPWGRFQKRPSPSPQSFRAGVRYCRWLTRRARSHFSLSFLFLPIAQRQAMEAVYAFCRAVDDVVDQDEARSEKRGARGGFHDHWAKEELNRWRQELQACAAGVPTHPITVALEPVIRRFEIPQSFFEKLIAGVEMDLAGRRYQTFSELQVYCEHVASVVGLVSVRIFAAPHPAADRYATHLGIAFQLTNILRDVQPDARQGRVYLPLEDLERFGVTEGDLAAGRRTEPFRRLAAFQCERAESHFRQAAEALAESGAAGRMTPARIMGAIYHRLLQRIEERDYDVFSERVRVPMMEQIWLALKSVMGFTR